MLLSEARTLMAADMTCASSRLPDAGAAGALDGLAARGVRRTWITETVTMVASAADARSAAGLGEGGGPGGVSLLRRGKLNPPRPLREALDAESVAVSDDLLLRLERARGRHAPASAARTSALPAW